ncbi:MAG: toll/interleukin-1 receptor domain-containing protein [bacterium]|nr:toll/interleukin-1 receptor domain-containing protein [bacterium]
MQIFLSYASEQRPLAERLALALGAEGHEVFFDRASLGAGEAYDQQIRESIAECDLFLFLVSPESVEEGGYARTEMGFAAERWSHPDQRVLPVIAEATPFDQIPTYLRAITILEPAGDPVAETVAAVAKLGFGKVRRRVKPVVIGLLVLVAAAALWSAVGRYRETAAREEAVAGLAAAAAEARLAGDFDTAWSKAEQALAEAPRNEAALAARRETAMAWVRWISVIEDTSDELMSKRVLQVLEDDLETAEGALGVDIEAHLVWAAALRPLPPEGSVADLVARLQKALEIDPANPYAHAMLGRFLAFGRDADPDQAKQHLRTAVESGRALPFVREIQLENLLERPVEEPEAVEALRLTNAMRLSGEPLPASVPARLYYLFLELGPYAPRADPRYDIDHALPPDEALDTYRWLIAGGVDDHDRATHRFVEARLLEEAGRGGEALAVFRELIQDPPGNRQFREAIEAGVARLSAGS